MFLYSLLVGLDIQGLLLFICAFLLITDFLKNRSPKNFPPGPRGLPFIGQVLSIDTKKPHIYLTKLADVYGSVFSLRLGRNKAVLITGYKMVKEVLVNQGENFVDRPPTPMMDRIFSGNGLIFSNGPHWKKQRRFTLSTLRNFGLGKKSLESVIVEESRFLQEALENEQGRPFDPHFILNNAVSNIICSLVFGHRFEYSDNDFQSMLKLLSETITLEGTAWAQNKEDIASGFHERNLVFCTLDLFLAGTETTSTTLRWALLYMMKYPEIQEKVQAEIDRVIGQARPPSMADRANMPYTDAVIHEVQRMGNIVPLNAPRMAIKDTTVGGYIIPKGTAVMAILNSVLFDKSEWQTPDSFIPEHFLDSQGNFVRREAFLPFSAGKRVCLGEQLARMELFLFFTGFFQKFSFSSAPGVEPSLEAQIGGTRSPYPYKIYVTPR
ncbi:cytochrome P450 2J2 isoform X2 [Amia ocellicauda]|uniref:cytochrome P450 2J2 isoform X2 n=1 Tax=Amia ocellicauda TaxID=2972642 RepID=UPI003463F08C